MKKLRLSAVVLALTFASPAFAQTSADNAAKPDPEKSQADNAGIEEVQVTASRLNLLGIAQTASQGSVTEKELKLRPVYRVGQLLETTPGLVVTIHSGEGKANQYLLRGFNLDHGTDIANFIDDMPINRPTNTHGQGYSDLNFELPEMLAGMDYTKGPYYAAVGDFGAVASTHMKLADEIPNQVSVTAGTLGRYTIFTGGTEEISDDDRIVGGLTFDHVDGPFTPPENFRKYAGEVRYSHGTDSDGYSLTVMGYKGDGLLTTDQPVAAYKDGLIGRYGTLDPTDASRSQRFSVSGHYAKSGDWWDFNASLYYINSKMTLWNDFTHYLDDPVNGDQEEQDENRNALGGQAVFTATHSFGSIDTSTVVGVQARYDDVWDDRRHTKARQILDYCLNENADGTVSYLAANKGNCQADRVHLLDLGPYIENTTHWTSWLRSILGAREEIYSADDTYFGVTAVNIANGTKLKGSQTLFQPKGSIVVGPFYETEFYFSAGRGFHSDDVRGVFGTVPLEGLPGVARSTPLLEPATGYEFGVRSNIIDDVSVQIALFREDFDSELTYDADQGQDAASGPSRRQGIEVSAQYKPFTWLELNTDLAFSRARYQGSAASLASYGIVGGAYIANAPSFIGSFGAIADWGAWFGGLQWRDLGAYPLTDGPQNPEDKGYSEFNANIGYRVNDHLTIEASGFNLLNSHAHSAAYDYTYRLTSTSAAEDGSTFHTLEPISGQVRVTWTF